MLIALIASLIISFLSPGISGELFIKETRKSVKQSIADSGRKKELSSHVDKMEKELKSFNKQLKKSGKSLSKLNKNYDSNLEDFETALDKLNEKRIISQERIVEIRFMMKDHMSLDEWKAVFKRDRH
jgi:septal ring factor EnvC (AmiA/AmiB activator)